MTKRVKPTSHTTAGLRAAIYVRVSSESQAERASPHEQELDCRELCASRKYTVVEVYRDIERFRVGGRLVEPSGTRADRPQLRAMLAAASTGAFDVIVAWREDRLYRGYRPMLDVLDCIEATGIDIELAKETFDRRIAPVKAWAAKMELDAKHDRFAMGVAARLKAGKPWLMVAPFGYARQGDQLVINEAEARWVRRIWEMFAAGLPGREVRRQLLEGNAPQRMPAKYRKYRWALGSVYKVIRYAAYYTGAVETKWDGEVYTCNVPVIVDAATAQAVQERLARWKRNPAGNLKARALAAGLVYCENCGRKMQVVSQRRGGHQYFFYKCTVSIDVGTRPDGCAGCIKMASVDDETWGKLWKLFGDPAEFEHKLQVRLAQIQSEEVDATAEVEQIEARLEVLPLERQWVITERRQGRITEDDYRMQLSTLTFEQAGLEKQLNELQLLVGDRAVRLLRAAEVYRANVAAGVEAINARPQNAHQAQAQFTARRKLVEGLITRVDVQPDKQIVVHVEMDVEEDQAVSAAGSPRSGSVTRHCYVPPCLNPTHRTARHRSA